MATKRERRAGGGRERAGEPERSSPTAVTIALMFGFVLLAIVGVFTVVMPEVRDDGDDEQDGAAEVEGDAVSEAAASGGRRGATSPSAPPAR